MKNEDATFMLGNTSLCASLYGSSRLDAGN